MQNQIPGILKSTALHHGCHQIKQWQKTSAEKSDSLWDRLCCSQHHIPIISVTQLYQAAKPDTRENPLQHSKSVGWYLASPCSHIPQKLELGSLAPTHRSVVPDLNNSIFSFRGRISPAIIHFWDIFLEEHSFLAACSLFYFVSSLWDFYLCIFLMFGS